MNRTAQSVMDDLKVRAAGPRTAQVSLGMLRVRATFGLRGWQWYINGRERTEDEVRAELERSLDNS